ncbi:TAFII55 protein conserved region-domain-containing protein [Panaeolus papilionaceus]|nr:TAFII55 protein conserved region-domain-containing protein [Panaeolus papilionaceus]
MEDDLIVVDDIDNEAGPSTHSRPKSGTERNVTSSRLRSGSNAPGLESTERTTRSSANRPKLQPKLKLKLGEKTAAQAPGMSFLGPYDRELDSDDEDLAFEEQFILRMPPGDDCEKLRKAITSREIGNDIWFKFKDSRRAVFHIGNNLYAAKLVDLPCIIEAQKTVDNTQMFKMLVVDKMIASEEQMMKEKGGFNIDEFIWPHGITPPLHHVRKRRFRKRVNHNRECGTGGRTAVGRGRTGVRDILENVNPDLSDSEFIDQEVPLDAPTPAVSDLGDVQTPGDIGEGEEEDEPEENEEEIEGDIDEELAAELDLALENDEDEDDDDEGEDDSEEEESEDDDDEDSQARRLLNEEIRDLEAAVAKKGSEIASSSNPLIKKRFEDALRKLKADLDMKLAQREELKERQRREREGISVDAADTDGENAGNEADLDEDDDGPIHSRFRCVIGVYYTSSIYYQKSMKRDMAACSTKGT